MRASHSIKNIYIGVFSEVVIALLGFLSRKVFLDNLGADYLGINGLMSNVLSALVLVEGGIAISIVYNLYKPLADNDREKIISLVQLYKKAYMVLALITLIISISLYPLLGHLMKNGDGIYYLLIIYSIFVAKNIVSYLNAHKWSLINADQRGYVLAWKNLWFQIITIVARIVILLSTKNYVLYLAIELLIYGIQNIVNGRIVNKRYPYIKTKIKYPLDKDIKVNIIMNVKAMFLRNIGSYLVFSTDNILISSFVSLATVGLYSNYTLITNQMNNLFSPILGGIGGSVGNLIATENSDKNFSIFKVSYLVNFWVCAICIIFLFNLIEPFISWWLGKQYLLDQMTFILILINFYLGALQTSIVIFKNKAGLFAQDKYASIIQGLINLIASLVLLHYFGLSGIFLGTTISTLATIFWTQPNIVYHQLFKRKVRFYYLKYTVYATLTIIVCFITKEICSSLVTGVTLLSLLERGLICITLPNIIFTSIFYRTNEFKYIRGIALVFLANLKNKFNNTINARA